MSFEKCTYLCRSFLGGSVIKNPTCQCKTFRRRGFSPWVGKIPWRRKWHPLQYFCLESPMDRGAWWLQPMGLQGVRHDLAVEYIRTHICVTTTKAMINWLLFGSAILIIMLDCLSSYILASFQLLYLFNCIYWLSQAFSLCQKFDFQLC